MKNENEVEKSAFEMVMDSMEQKRNCFQCVPEYNKDGFTGLCQNCHHPMILGADTDE